MTDKADFIQFKYKTMLFSKFSNFKDFVDICKDDSIDAYDDIVSIIHEEEFDWSLMLS